MKTTITIEDIKTSEGNDGINYRIEFEPELTDQNTPALELSQEEG